MMHHNAALLRVCRHMNAMRIIPHRLNRSSVGECNATGAIGCRHIDTMATRRPRRDGATIDQTHRSRATAPIHMHRMRR